MYYIVKEIYVSKKPLWLVDLLIQINPSLYREKGSKEMIETKFNIILSLILNAKVRWHHGKSLLSAIQVVTYDETCIWVKGNRGVNFLSFRIESDNSSLKTKNI